MCQFVYNHVVLFGDRFPQAKAAITEKHSLEFSEKHVSNLCFKPGPH